MPSPLHEARLETVTRVLRGCGARTVLDLGCGTGELILRLLPQPGLSRVVGLDESRPALDTARQQIRQAHGADERVILLHASCNARDDRLRGFDAAALVETIEHIPPDRLSSLESALFRYHRPRLVAVTTPNRDCNDRQGVPGGRLRHRDHRFEWSRERFARWAGGVAARNGYRVDMEAIGPCHPRYGAPTQMAVFRMEARANAGA